MLKGWIVKESVHAQTNFMHMGRTNKDVVVTRDGRGSCEFDSVVLSVGFPL
jgi:hypothetical protein